MIWFSTMARGKPGKHTVSEQFSNVASHEVLPWR